MAQTDPFPRDALQEMVIDVADWLEASELPSVGIEISAMPLSIWDVKPGPSLCEVARNSGEWHHQISNEDGALAYARSRVADGRAEIVELVESPLAKVLEEILGTLGNAADDSTTLRLLRSLRHHATFLWIHREGGADEAVALQGPALRIGERFDEPSFLAKLAALPPPGMTATAPRDPRCRDVRLWGSNRAQPVRQVER